MITRIRSMNRRKDSPHFWRIFITPKFRLTNWRFERNVGIVLIRDLWEMKEIGFKGKGLRFDFMK